MFAYDILLSNKSMDFYLNILLVITQDNNISLGNLES